MSLGAAQRVKEVLPDKAWDTLKQNDSAALIDVRTRAEWGFVGVPDLESLGRSTLFVEWSKYPEMSVNPHFVETVLESLGTAIPKQLFFICRSGVRSLRAADAVAQTLADRGIEAECINVAEGFEGDLDSEGHRGQLNGWKIRGLAWSQS